MSVIRIGGFRGEIPRIHPRLLPEGNAQTAVNCRLDSGAVESVKDAALYANLQTKPTASWDAISLFRYSPSVWLEAQYDYDWVSFPLANDTYNRLLFKDPTSSFLLVTDSSIIGNGSYSSGSDNVANSYLLAVPAPQNPPAVALSGDPDDAETNADETRYYVVTYVNAYGAEGPPSPPSNQIEWRFGQQVVVSSIPSPTGNYNITHRRLYRLNTGSTGSTNYQFVSEISLTQTKTQLSTVTAANPVVVTTLSPHNLTTGMEVKFTNLGTQATVEILQISKSNPCRITTTTAHGFSSFWTVEIAGLGGPNGMDELNGTRAAITVIDSTRFDLVGVDATGYTDYVGAGTAARTFGMDELNNNQYFITVTDTDTFALNGIDGTGYKAYIEGGEVEQLAGATYTDNVPSANLAEILPTELYDPPNPATKGIKEHPAGFLVGFFDRTLCFSEPGAPHAWPIDYRLATNHDIIGLGIFGNTVAVVTKGWPYLVIGSDPSAMTMVELEIEQACAAKRGIVDFGTAIVYPSPDGLILISANGAANVSSGIFTRDQWQALVPSSFVAFNWEQKYLCFYDDGTTKQAFLIDPFVPEYGVRYINKYAIGGYKDIEEDLLYLIIDDLDGSDPQIHKWDQSPTKLSYTWKSKPVYTPRAVNMAAAKVIADGYPVTAEFYVDNVKRYTHVVGSLEAFRLPGGFRGEEYEIVIKGTNRVSEVIMATTMSELSVTV